MKVLHVNMSLNPISGGGTVERVTQLHRSLIDLGVKSHIVTIGYNYNATNSRKSLPEVTSIPSLNDRWFIPFPSIIKVRKLVDQADVIHLINHWTLINAWVYLLARKRRKPYIICPAGALTIYGRSKVKKYFYQWLIGRNILKHASAAIAVSRNEVKVLEIAGVDSETIHHIPNGVNDEDFSCCDPTLFREISGIGSVPYILFLGRLNLIKGPDLLLSAYAQLSSDIPYHLVIAGPDGGLFDGLKKRVLDLNLNDRVHFTGHLAGDVKSSACHEASVLVVPSRHEAMSIVALEAAISGTPVLMTDRCGFPALAEAGAAIEVPANINGLSEGLRKLLGDECNLDEMGVHARAFALKHYTWSIMAKRFIEIVRSNCDGNRNVI